MQTAKVLTSVQLGTVIRRSSFMTWLLLWGCYDTWDLLPPCLHRRRKHNSARKCRQTEKEETAIFPLNQLSLPVPKKFTQLFESLRQHSFISLHWHKSQNIVQTADASEAPQHSQLMQLSEVHTGTSRVPKYFSGWGFTCTFSLSPPSPYVWKKRPSKLLFVRKAVGPGWEPSSPCNLT